MRVRTYRLFIRAKIKQLRGTNQSPRIYKHRKKHEIDQLQLGLQPEVAGHSTNYWGKIINFTSKIVTERCYQPTCPANLGV